MLQSKTIGLHKALTDPSSGAPVTFFTLSQYTVRIAENPGSQAVVQGYVSQAAHEAGKRPLTFLAVDLPARPEGDTLQWLYAQIPAQAGELEGAVPVASAETAEA